MKTNVLKKSLLDYAITGRLTTKYRRETPSLNAYDEIHAYNERVRAKRKELEKECKKLESTLKNLGKKRTPNHTESALSRHCETSIRSRGNPQEKQNLKNQIQTLKKELARLKEITPLDSRKAPTAPCHSEGGRSPTEESPAKMDCHASTSALTRNDKKGSSPTASPARHTEFTPPFAIPESWAWVRLGDICEITMGQSPESHQILESASTRDFSPTAQNDKNRECDKNRACPTDVAPHTQPPSCHTDPAPCHSLLSQESEESKKLPIFDVKYLRGKGEKKLASSGSMVVNGDRLILMDGENSGEIFIAKEKGFLGSTLKKLDFSCLVAVEFMDFMLLCYKDFFKGNKKGAAIPHLDRHLFASLPLPLPPLQEQAHIAQKLEELVSLAEEYHDIKEELKRIEKRIEKSLLKIALEGILSKGYRHTHSSLNTLDEINAYNERVRAKRKELEKECKKLESTLKNLGKKRTPNHTESPAKMDCHASTSAPARNDKKGSSPTASCHTERSEVSTPIKQKDFSPTAQNDNTPPPSHTESPAPYHCETSARSRGNPQEKQNLKNQIQTLKKELARLKEITPLDSRKSPTASCHSEGGRSLTEESTQDSTKDSLPQNDKNRDCATKSTITLTPNQQSLAQHPAYTYMMSNHTNSTLYIGVTSNIIKRIYEHKNKLVSGFTQKYNCTKLVYFEAFDTINQAIEREKYLKGKKRSFKNSLIESINPHYEDISEYLGLDSSPVSQAQNDKKSSPKAPCQATPTSCQAPVAPCHTPTAHYHTTPAPCHTERSEVSMPTKQKDFSPTAQNDNTTFTPPFAISESWAWVRLGDICEIQSGGTPDTKNPLYWATPSYSADSTPCHSEGGRSPTEESMQNTDKDSSPVSQAQNDKTYHWATLVDTKEKYLYTTQRKITQKGLDSSSAVLLPINTILLSSRASIGEVCITKIETATNQGYKNFICGETIFYEYLYFALQHFTNTFVQQAQGTTYKEISKTQLENFTIPLPPLQEQAHIASTLEGLFTLGKHLRVE